MSDRTRLKDLTTSMWFHLAASVWFLSLAGFWSYMLYENGVGFGAWRLGIMSVSLLSFLVHGRLFYKKHRERRDLLVQLTLKRLCDGHPEQAR